MQNKNKLELELNVDCFPWLFEPSLYGEGLAISLRRITVEGGISDDIEIYVREAPGCDSVHSDALDDSAGGRVDAWLMDLDELLQSQFPTGPSASAPSGTPCSKEPSRKRTRRGRRAGQRVQASRLKVLAAKVARLEAAFERMFSGGRWERHAFSRKRCASEL